jgi:hypothetical protein
MFLAGQPIITACDWSFITSGKCSWRPWCAYFLAAFTRAHRLRWPALILASPSAEI